MTIISFVLFPIFTVFTIITIIPILTIIPTFSIIAITAKIISACRGSYTFLSPSGCQGAGCTGVAREAGSSRASLDCVAVKELKVSYCDKELYTSLYTHIRVTQFKTLTATQLRLTMTRTELPRSAGNAFVEALLGSEPAARSVLQKV